MPIFPLAVILAPEILTVPALMSNPVAPMNSPPVTVNSIVDGKKTAAEVFDVNFPSLISILAFIFNPFPEIADAFAVTVAFSINKLAPSMTNMP